MTMIPIGPIKEVRTNIILCYTNIHTLKPWYEEQFANRSLAMCVRKHACGRTYVECMDHPYTDERYVMITKFIPCNITHEKGVHDVAGLQAHMIMWVDVAPTRTQMAYLNSRLRSRD